MNVRRAEAIARVKGTEIDVSTDDLVDAGAALIDMWETNPELRTQIHKLIASIIVKLRNRFTDANGKPDWAGHSWDYRQTVARIYERANADPKTVRKIQDSIRFHIGNLIREVVPTDEIEDAGLHPESPKARLQSTRQQMAQLRDALKAIDLPPGTSGRAMRTLNASIASLQASLDELPNVPVEDQEAVVRQLQDVAELTDRALKALQGLRSSVARSDRAPHVAAKPPTCP